MRRLLVVFDPLFVILFVAIGRDTHDEPSTLGGLATTAAPLLVALAAGWLVARIWRDPEGLLTGILVASVTLAGGMALRALVFDEGTAAAFVVVATAFLGGSIIGWRLIAARFTAAPD